MDTNEMTKLILYVIALAMGVASTVLSLIGESLTTIPTLLGIAVLCIALAGLNSIKSHKL